MSTTALFEELGLSPNEAKIYMALLTYGGSGVSTIALRAKIHRSNAYDTLHRLIEKGLVYELLGERETVYEPVDPVKFKEILSENMWKFDAILPTLTKSFRKRQAPERAYLFKGIEGVKNYMRLALRASKDIYTLGGKGAWLDPRLASTTAAFMEELKRKGIQKKILFESSIRSLTKEQLKGISTQYKFLPINVATTSSVDIFGEYVVSFAGSKVMELSEDFTIFVIASEKLAESYRNWWKMLWDLLPNAS